MLDARVFLVTRILMICSLCIFLLIGLGIKKIAKTEEINDFKIHLFGRFEAFCKICTVFSVGILVLLVIWDMIK